MGDQEGAPVLTSFESSLVGLVVAAVVPLLLLKAGVLVRYRWPNYLYRRLTARFDRQIASVMERVHLNRLIQDDIMVQNIMGYVSYCYVRMLAQRSGACDAVDSADYEYAFLYESSREFREEWVPPSARFQTLYGRTIASCMELSVVPSAGSSIQVEPGLFVRTLPNKHLLRPSSAARARDGGDAPRRKEKRGAAAATSPADFTDRLNNYLFYDMRQYVENMDAHPVPSPDSCAHDGMSDELPFDAASQREGRCRSGKEGSGSNSSSSSATPPFTRSSAAVEDRVIVLEYRKPLPHEHATALCSPSDPLDSGSCGIHAYDAARPAEDVIEAFLARVQAWYLGHVARTKFSALLAIYPAMYLKAFSKFGASVFAPKYSAEADFPGRSYVLEAADPGEEAETRATPVSRKVTPHAEASVSPASRASSAATTLAGGRVGLHRCRDTTSSGGKTFASLFFPDKDRVLSMIEDFVHERGAYGVPGVTSRLTFFLHGAPGTGKTSFVKALARHLRRHLVVVPLSDVVTVGELRTILGPFRIDLTGEGTSHYESIMPVSSHQVVYVLEDFDAIGDAWEALRCTQTQRGALAHTGTTANADIAADDAAQHESNQSGRSSSSLPSQQSSVRGRHGEGTTESEESDGDSDRGSSSSSSSDKFVMQPETFEEVDRDKLTVGRFLDLFNGFNLPHSSIVVFTTNYPDRIHHRIFDANIIDMTLNMGFLDVECAIQMIEHYYRGELSPNGLAVDDEQQRHLSPAQLADLRAALQKFNAKSEGLSGALLENMCIECDSVASLTARLRTAEPWDTTEVF